MLNNLPQVTKNIILLNIMFFIATIVLQTQGIDLTQTLGAHYVNSPLFQPYQIVTHFFMHGGFLHILFNMYLFAILGAYLEHIWGPKRFFIFYFASAIGAFVLYNILGVYELAQLKSEIISQGGNISEINQYIKDGQMGSNNLLLHYYIQMCRTPMVGASGAIFGLMAAYLVIQRHFGADTRGMLVLVGINLVLGFFPGTNISWQAHVGGLLTGAAIAWVYSKTRAATAGRQRALLVWLVLGVLVALTVYGVSRLVTGY